MTITAEMLLTLKDRTTIGMSLLHDIVNDRQHVVEIAHGLFDKELRLGLFYAIHDRYPVKPEECNTPEIDVQLTVFKNKAATHAVDNIRESRLIAALNEYDRRFEMKPRHSSWQESQNRMMEARRKEFAEQTKPHAEGTVKEIAAKYGLSLGEVRRRKAAGIPFGEPA